MKIGSFSTHAQAVTRFQIVLALTFVAAAAAGARSSLPQDVITGCFPLTVEDGALFHPPAFADYPATSDFQGRPAPVDLASHPLASRFRTGCGTRPGGGRTSLATTRSRRGDMVPAAYIRDRRCVQRSRVLPAEGQFVEMMRVMEHRVMSDAHAVGR